MKAIMWISAILIFLVYPLTHFVTMDTVTAIVTDKERITDKSGENRFIIWTKDDTFQNSDSLLSLKFRSSDLYGKIAEGDNCTFKVNFWRIPIMSRYRNIITADCKAISAVVTSTD